MTDTREATPRPHTPWEIRGGDGYGDLVGTGIEDARGYTAVVAIGDVPELDHAYNAALIVRAVNSDDLWPEAIRIIKALYAAVLIDDEEGLAEHAEPMEAARALLSKLEASHGSA